MEQVHVPEILRIFLFDDLVAQLVGGRDDGAAALARVKESVAIDFLSDGVMDDVTRNDTFVVRRNPRIDPERFDADDFFLLIAHRSGHVHHVKNQRIAFGALLGLPREITFVFVDRDDVRIQRIVRAGRDLPLQCFLISAFEVTQRFRSDFRDLRIAVAVGL